jgi:hypothetical protein
MVKVPAQYYVVRNEFGSTYSPPKRSPISGGCRRVNVNDNQQAAIGQMESYELSLPFY